jgi:O-antigen ligase
VKFIKQNWLYVLLVLLPLERIPSWDVAVLGKSVSVRLSFILALLLLLYYLPGILWRYKLRLSDPITWLFGYLFVTGLSVLASLDPKRGVIALFATCLTILTGVVVAKNLHKFDLNKVYWSLLAITVGVCLFGLYQFIGDSLGLSTSLTGLRTIYTHAVFGFPRIQSTALEPLYLGNFLLIPLILLVGRMYTGNVSKKEYGILYLLVITLILTLSRGAFASSVVGIGLLAVIFMRKTSLKRAGSILLVAALATGTAFGMITFASLSANKSNGTSQKPAVETFVAHSTTISTAGQADSDRGVTLKLAETGFKQEPILGHGLASFGTYAAKAQPQFNNNTIVNNEYWEVLFETGIAGAFMLIGFLLTLAYQGYRAWKANKEYRLWIASLGAIVVGFMIQYYAFSTLYILHIWVVIGLLIGFISMSLKEQKDDSPINI